MSENIKAGDLVMVVKPLSCCGRFDGVGFIYTVTGLPSHKLSRCGYCGIVEDSINELKLSDGSVCEISRLKKIPPLSDLEDVETHSKDLIPNKKETIGEMA